MTLYAAYEIDEASRRKLLDIFTPKYPEVIAHHITHKYGAEKEDVPPPPQSVKVVGYHDSGAIQVLVVEVDGERHQAKVENGIRKFYHITFSLDRAQGASPGKSNAFLEKLAAEKGLDAIYNLETPVEINVAPKLIFDPPSFAQACGFAEKVLAKKTAGPNGIVAYAIVNDVRTRADGVIEPYFNPQSSAPAQLAYAFSETNRVGVPVISAPGGTQDICAVHHITGEKMMIELTKEKEMVKTLEFLGEEIPAFESLAAFEKHTVAKLIEKGWRVDIEDPFTAAVREAKEEQGIDLASEDSYIGEPLAFERAAITKRTLEAQEKAKGASYFDMKTVADFADVKASIDLIRKNAVAGVPVDAPQNLFAVRVADFSNVTPVDLQDQLEDKIKARAGSRYYERGCFVTLAQMQEQLVDALPLAKKEAEHGNHLAGNEIIATYERLNILRRIEAALVKDLRARNILVSSDVPPELADTPDNVGAAPPKNVPKAPTTRR